MKSKQKYCDMKVNIGRHSKNVSLVLIVYTCLEIARVGLERNTGMSAEWSFSRKVGGQNVTLIDGQWTKMIKRIRRSTQKGRGTLCFVGIND